MKYSVIIPAYNAEKTLACAVQSALDSFSDAEIIIAENGSTDGTSECSEKLTAADSRIRLIHTEKGVSKARNAGIKAAVGEWIIFLDADDILTCDILAFREDTAGGQEVIGGRESSGNFAKADILICGYYKGKKTVIPDFYTANTVLSGKDIEKLTALLLKNPTRWMTLWAKLYRRSFLIENSLFLDEELGFSEDSEFLIRALLRCTGTALIPVPMYRYCVGGQSLMRSEKAERQAAYLRALKKCEADLENSGEDIKKAFPRFCAAHLLLCAVHDIYNCSLKIKWAERNRKMRALLNTDIYRRNLGKMTFADFLHPSTLPVLFFRMRLLTAGGLICYFRSVRNAKLITASELPVAE